MIPTVFSNETELLQAIITLHAPQGFDLDPTFNKGGFWRGLPEPRLKFDLAPVREDVTQADVRQLPLDRRSVQNAVFDPPFVHAHGKNSRIGNRYGSYPTQAALQAMYREATTELYRVLVPGGALAWKCQDIVEGGKQVWSHIAVYNMATEVGFVAADLFILTAERRLKGHNHGRQVHARRFHCYWWVFRKPKVSASAA